MFSQHWHSLTLQLTSFRALGSGMLGLLFVSFRVKKETGERNRRTRREEFLSWQSHLFRKAKFFRSLDRTAQRVYRQEKTATTTHTGLSNKFDLFMTQTACVNFLAEYVSKFLNNKYNKLIAVNKITDNSRLQTGMSETLTNFFYFTRH